MESESTHTVHKKDFKNVGLLRYQVFKKCLFEQIQIGPTKSATLLINPTELRVL